jgi:hypothetical protein
MRRNTTSTIWGLAGRVLVFPLAGSAAAACVGALMYLVYSLFDSLVFGMLAAWVVGAWAIFEILHGLRTRARSRAAAARDASEGNSAPWAQGHPIHGALVQPAVDGEGEQPRG